MSKKVYLNINVYDAAMERIDFIFKEFEEIYVSFSGGKDSAIMLNLVLDYMRKNNINKKIGVLFIDLEGQYTSTINYIKETIEENIDLIIPYWICLPMNLRNAVSVYQPFWCCWQKEHKDKWVREMPEMSYVINETNNTFDFYKHRMEFEEFVPQFGGWFGKGKKTACLVGIRTDESLNRFRTINSDNKENYKGKIWTTFVKNNTYNCYPIYDWGINDLWVANYKFGYKYNPLYDMFYKAGVSLSNMRICQPYGDDQRIGINLYRVIEPKTWAKLLNRVSGANFGNIYAGNKILGYRKVDLPKGHTWKSYTKLLLKTLPNEVSSNYTKKFIKFMRWWNKKGSPIREEDKQNIPCFSEISDNLSTRGKKNKNVLRYKKIPDKLDNNFESKKLGPTWRRMAICILKNDQLCKSLSFTQTKEQTERQRQLMQKYQNL